MILLLMLAVFIFPLCAETVMVSIQTAEGSPLAEHAGLLPVAYAIEDGAMNEFFDMGHIIFNAGIKSSGPPEPPYPSESPEVRVAKAGGASFLLELLLSYSGLPENGDVKIDAVSYRFSNVLTGKLLADGVVSADSVPPEKKTAEEIGFELGRILALIALSVI